LWFWYEEFITNKEKNLPAKYPLRTVKILSLTYNLSIITCLRAMHCRFSYCLAYLGVPSAKAPPHLRTFAERRTDAAVPVRSRKAAIIIRAPICRYQFTVIPFLGFTLVVNNVFPLLRNYVHDFDRFVQCAEEFEAMCSNRKSSAEELCLIGVDEITSMK
jgi:hypothetical protein